MALITVGCKLLAGLIMEVGLQRVVLVGSAGTTVGYGLTPNVDQTFYNTWTAAHSNAPYVLDGSIFINASAPPVPAPVSEGSALTTGILQFPTFAALQAAVTTGAFLVTREALVLADETNGGVRTQYLWDGLVLSKTGTAGAVLQTGPAPLGYVWSVTDGADNASFGVKANGALSAEALEVGTLNGALVQAAAVVRGGGRFLGQLNFINNTGQSLGEGSDGALTDVQEYDNIGFPARSTSPTATIPLTVANTQWQTRGESPMYGATGFIKELLLKEDGINFTENDYQLLACNNAYGGYAIDQLNKGTAPYAAALSQVQAGYDLAMAAGKTFAFQCSLWTQGEGDYAMEGDVYRDKLIQLANDYDADGKAITGQRHDVLTICYQGANNLRRMAIAQLQASELSDKIVMACPMYQFDYFDNLHINALSSKWLGGYYGLAYKRSLIDGHRWQPLKPVSHAISGNTIDLFFNKQGLTLDTTLVPAQPNFGFDVLDGAAAAVAISSVTVIAPNRVRIVCASAPAAGWSIRYGYGSAVGKGPFVGGCGNLRDRQGDSIIYAAINKPMHNWSVIFNYSV